MKVSIITATMNSESTVKDSIQSLNNQKYKNIEHIIIDGNSKDDTLKIINECKKINTVIVSESDNGVYDALNKGIKLASGDLIGILHSNDVFYSDEVIDIVVNKFKNHDIEMLAADLIITDLNTNNIIRYYRGFNDPKSKFEIGVMPPHPTVFIKKRIFDIYGYYSCDYRIASDYEYLLKLIYINEIKYKYVEKIFIKMRTGGLSNSGIKSKLRINYEIFKINKKYKIKFLFLRKFLYRIFEYFDKPDNSKK